MRGKPAGEDLFFVFSRNIPACAGKTDKATGMPVQPTEHPRVRGENSYICLFASSRAGTSPRARGKQVMVISGDSSPGNIPACAGKTPRGMLISDPQREHPRVRGENDQDLGYAIKREGTYPRARGKPHKFEGFHGLFRNIPACAGKTSPGGVV